MSCFACLLECERVAPERLGIGAQFLVGAAEEHALAQLAAQEPQRDPECPAGVILIQLRPEERHDDISAMELSRTGKCEVHQEGESLRLREDRLELSPIGIPYFQHP
jgi:hypothetical protein